MREDLDNVSHERFKPSSTWAARIVQEIHYYNPVDGLPKLAYKLRAFRASAISLLPDSFREPQGDRHAGLPYLLIPISLTSLLASPSLRGHIDAPDAPFYLVVQETRERQ